MSDPKFSGGGFIPGPGFGFQVRELQPKQRGDIDDTIIDRNGEVQAYVRFYRDGTASYREPTPEEQLAADEREFRQWWTQQRVEGKDSSFNFHIASRRIEIETCRMLAPLLHWLDKWIK